MAFLKLIFVACVSTSVLGACTLVPGMQFSANTPVDPNDPSSVPTVTPITPKLIHEQLDTQEQQKQQRMETNYGGLVSKTGAYRIGANDVLSITIWDHPELIAPNLTYTLGATGAELPTVTGSSPPLAGFSVSDGGYIQLPYAGLLKVAGLTEIEAQRLVARSLVQYIRDPQITLRVAAYLSKRIYVAGEVKTPGTLAITGVPMNLPAALGAAGGMTDLADQSHIALSRGGKVYDLNLPQLLADGVNPTQIELRDGDLVRVLPRENYKVMVVGEVLQPKAVPMRNNGRLTLSEALGEASGVSPTTAAPNAIYVIRTTGNAASPEVFQLNAKSPVGMALAEDFQLKAKDVVYVDATGLVRWNRVISLIAPTGNSVYLGENIGRAY